MHYRGGDLMTKRTIIFITLSLAFLFSACKSQEILIIDFASIHTSTGQTYEHEFVLANKSNDLTEVSNHLTDLNLHKYDKSYFETKQLLIIYVATEHYILKVDDIKLNDNNLHVQFIRTTKDIETGKAFVFLELESNHKLSFDSVSYEIRDAIKSESIRIVAFKSLNASNYHMEFESFETLFNQTVLINSVRELDQYLKSRSFGTIYDYAIYDEAYFQEYTLIIFDFHYAETHMIYQPQIVYNKQTIQFSFNMGGISLREPTFYHIVIGIDKNEDILEIEMILV